MPRVAGVSGSSAVRPIRLSLSPIRVSRWRMVAADRAAGLLDLDRFVGLAHLGLPARGLQRATRSTCSVVAFAAARLQRRNLDVAPRRDRARQVLALERIEGRPHHVVGVGRAERLRHHVLHAERLEHGAHRAAGDDAGAGRRRAQKDLAGAMAAGHVVMQRAAFAQRHADQTALGGFGRLADRLRHLARLAVAEADPALLVADDDERGKAEAPAALHHLGHAIDVDELVGEFAVFAARVRVPSRCSIRCSVWRGFNLRVSVRN